MSIEAMKQALEALETYHGYMEPLTTVFGGPRVPAEQSTTGKVERAITSLRIALEEAPAKQEQGEPVGYFKREGDVWFQYYEDYPVPSELTPLYTTPQPAQKPWVGLTDEDLNIAFDDTQEGGGFWEFGYAIEAILKRKNHG